MAPGTWGRQRACDMGWPRPHAEAGHCACEVKNPQGSCCLGNVSKALNQIRFEAASTSS